MGILRGCICSKCKKKYEFAFGCGYFSIPFQFVSTIYACEKCGYWENAYLESGKLSKSERRNLNKKYLKEYPIAKCFVKKIKVIDSEKKCPFCNTIMKAKQDLIIKDNTIFPKLICKECKSELNYAWTELWD